MSHHRSINDLLAFLTAHEHQLESDRALVKQMVIAKVDSEFDVLLAKVRAHKTRIEEVIRKDNDDGTDSDNHSDGDQTLPSTSTNRTSGRERKARKNVNTRNKSQFSCIYPGCGKSFLRDFSLTRHERTHTGVCPFNCTWRGCHYEAVQRSAVVRHIRTIHLKLPETKKTQLALNITDRRDPNRWVRVNQQLANIRLTRANIRFYIGIKSVNGEINKKRKTPNKVNPFVCRSPGCGESYTTNGNRLAHERAIHLRAKPFGCTWPHCGLVASTRTNVVSHIRNVHFGLPPTVKLQRQLSITDDRDPYQWVSVNEDEANRRLE